MQRKSLVIIGAIAILAMSAVILLMEKQPLLKSDFNSSNSSRQAPSGSKTYEDLDYGFSFFYPQDFSVGAFSGEENTKTVLVQDENKKTGVQVYISSFGEDITLTPERIKKDAPDVLMNDVKTVSLDGVNTVSFGSVNSSGQSREVWFVHKSNLYQISTPQTQRSDLKNSPRSDLDPLDDIIKSWQWNQ